jgi:phosphatidylglycerophosphatase C
VSQKKIFALFDFDGTITKRDTFIGFLIFSFGYFKFIKAILLLSPLLFLYIFRLVPNYFAKQKLFSFFFKGVPEQKFNNLCEKYSLSEIDKILNNQAVDIIKKHKNRKHKLIVVSASLENWIEPWAIRNGFEHTIATIVEINDGFLTGKFKSKNCYGIEKINRILKKYPDRKNLYIFAYGNSKGDRELLLFADEGFMKFTKYIA